MGRWGKLAESVNRSGEEVGERGHTQSETNDRTTEGRAPAPAEMPDPGARCAVHKRLLTFAEQLHGGCSWCEWLARRQSGARAPGGRRN